MKLLFLIGVPVVSKMTVEQALTKITNFRLFHNHITIEPVIELLGESNLSITNKLRRYILKNLQNLKNTG